MASLKIEAFGGMIPTLDDRLLPNNNATVSQNVWLYDGKLEALRVLMPVYTLLDPATKAVYRIPLAGPLAINIATSQWIEFAGINTTVARSPVLGQADPAFYWAGNTPSPFLPRYNTMSRLQAGTKEMILGVLPPSNPLTVGVAGGVSTILETRSYAHTYVTFFGEEGPPSLPTAVTTGKIDDTWTVTIPATVPSDRGDATKVITAITRAAQAQVTVAGHGYTVGQRIFTAGVVGMTQINNLYATVVQVVDANNFKLGLDTSAFTAYSSGGTAQRVDREYTKIRIYRTIVSAQGVGSFNQVIELPIGSTTFADTLPSATVALNNPLLSTEWFPPPALDGIASMPNGMLIGWFGNQLWFCEPFRPHAWPASYQTSTAANIVGIGVVGQSAVICTEGIPYLCSGTHPSNMVLGKSGATSFPCTSAGSILPTPEGVYYLSEVGLMLIGPGAPILATKGLASQDDWQRLVASDRFHAAILNGAYYGYSGVSDGAFEPTAFEPTAFAETAVGDVRGGVFIDLADRRVAFNTLFYALPIINVWKDPWSNEVLVIQNGKVCHVDLTHSALEDKYTWKSKIFRMDYGQNLSICRVFHTSPPGLAVPQTSIVNVYASRDGNQDPTLIYSRTVPAESGEYFRLPSGALYDQYQFEFIGNLQIISFQAATSAKELRGL